MNNTYVFTVHSYRPCNKMRVGHSGGQKRASEYRAHCRFEGYFSREKTVKDIKDSGYADPEVTQRDSARRTEHYTLSEE